MLLKKQLYILFFYFKQQNSKKKNVDYNITYILSNNDLLLYYSILNYIHLYTKQKINCWYVYYLKVIVPNWIIFNSVLIFIFKLVQILRIKINLSFDIIKKKNLYFTILRSTFKYKKSRECFNYSNYIGIIKLKLVNINFFLICYLELIIHNFFSNWLNSYIVLHRYIYKV